MTAAHCVKSIKFNDTSLWTVKLGAHNLSVSEPSVQNIPVKRVIIHPLYGKGKSGLLTNDVSLIELSRPAILNNRVAVGCLPSKNVYPNVSTLCYVIGELSLVHK